MWGQSLNSLFVPGHVRTPGVTGGTPRRLAGGVPFLWDTPGREPRPRVAARTWRADSGGVTGVTAKPEKIRLYLKLKTLYIFWLYEVMFSKAEVGLCSVTWLNYWTEEKSVVFKVAESRRSINNLLCCVNQALQVKRSQVHNNYVRSRSREGQLVGQGAAGQVTITRYE